jgi:uncharacterized protein YciI
MRAVLAVVLPALLLMAAAAGLATAVVTRLDPPPAIPPAVAPHIPKNVRPYFLAFFVNPAKPREMPFDLFVRHQAYMRRQFESGVYHLAGPLTDEGRIRGVMILSAPSAEAARAIVAADPAVQEGVMAVEIHPAMLPSLDALEVEYPER